jgi:hypothetical protein
MLAPALNLHLGNCASGPCFVSISVCQQRQTRRVCLSLLLSIPTRLFCFIAFSGGPRTVYQHGTDVNVLLERRAAVVSTQSQHRSRKKWRIDIAPCACAGATGWPHRCSALEKYRSDGKSLYALFSDCVGSLDFGMVNCAACRREQRQVTGPRYHQRPGPR